MRIKLTTAGLFAVIILLITLSRSALSTASLPAGYASFVASQTKSPSELMPQRSRKIFIGSIGGKYDIRMYLWREGKDFSGDYLYETNGGSIGLAGTIETNGSFVLKESDVEGNQSGVFKGKLTRNVAGTESLLHLEGTWSKPDGTSAMPFVLDEQRINLGGGMRLISKTLVSKNKKPAYSIEGQYPQIEGSTDAGVIGFNKAVNSLITSQIADFKKDVADADSDAGATTESGLTVDFEITTATSDLISVAFASSPYFAGAAHPNHYTSVLNYDLKTGKSIALADVFKPGSNYLQVLANYCIAQLKKRLGEMSDSSTINEGASAKLENYQSWNIGKKGLEITFDPYQVAAYAAGPQRVIVRYDALKNLLNPNGPVAGFAR